MNQRELASIVARAERAERIANEAKEKALATYTETVASWVEAHRLLVDLRSVEPTAVAS